MGGKGAVQPNDPWQAARVHGVCSHAYGIRRRDAGFMYRHIEEPTAAMLPSHSQRQHIDVQLRDLTRSLGGVYLVGAARHSPWCKGHLGVLYQDKAKACMGDQRTPFWAQMNRSPKAH